MASKKTDNPLVSISFLSAILGKTDFNSSPKLKKNYPTSNKVLYEE